MQLKLFLNSGVGLNRSPSPGSLGSHWLGHLPGFALMILLNSKSLRVKIKSCKEVGHLNKAQSVILQAT